MMDISQLAHDEEHERPDNREALLEELIDKLSELMPLVDSIPKDEGQKPEGADPLGDSNPKAKIEMMAIDAKPKEKMHEGC